jgi:NTE family protein
VATRSVIREEPGVPLDAGRAPSTRSHRRRGPPPQTVLAVASLGAAVAFVDATIVNIAFPNIALSFRGTSISSLSWVLNAYNIVFAAFLVAAGRIGDLLGRRRMFILGLEIFTLASVLCAVAPSAAALIAFRIIQAFGAALLVPCSLALVLNAFAVEERAHGVALLSAVAAAAAGLGPSLGGLLVSVDDWRLVFLVNIPIGSAAVVLARRYLVESRTPGRRQMPDMLGACLFALAVAALVLGVVKGQEWGWTGARVIGSFAVAVVLGAVFVWRCTWHRAPIFDLALLRIRTFSAANAMTMIASAGFYGYTLTNVLFLTGVWHYSVLQAGLSLTPGPFVAAVVAGPSSRLMQRFGPRPVLFAGGIIWGAAVLWFVERVGVRPDFLGQWLPGMLFLGVGAGMLLPNVSGAAVASAPGESFATATGLNSVARQVGAALGVALVVAIIGTPTPLTAAAAFQHAWSFGSVCLFAAGVGCLLVRRVALGQTPPLAESARFVLQAERPVDARPRAERARRAIRVSEPAAAEPRPESPADFLARVPMFAELPADVRQALAADLRGIRVPAGDWLFRQGESAEAMFIVRIGRLEVIDESSGATIRQLGRGDAVGELALITGATRSASVRAARTSDLLALDRSRFQELLTTSPGFSLGITRVLGQQLQSSRAAVPTARPQPTTVTLVSLDERVPLAALAHDLADQLRSGLRAAALDEPRVERSEPDSAATWAPILDAAEGRNDLVLLVGGSFADPRPWTEFCVQQADRILAVTPGGPVSERAAERPELRGCDLVGYDVRPGSGALAGLTQRLEPTETHVIREAERTQDLARLARRLSGRSVGVVLSGGGARAFAHIGVLDELLAAGIKVDRVGGVSMGAYIGALFSMGLDAEEMDACCFEEWIQRRPLADYTLPRHGLIRGERVKRMLQRSFGEVAIEELTRSFMCGYGELRSASLILARSGPLWEAVGLSINIPILGAPQVHGRDLLIDGSLVDNLPVRAMSDLGEGPVIAVDVKATWERPARSASNAAVAAEPAGLAPKPSAVATEPLSVGTGSAGDSVPPAGVTSRWRVTRVDEKQRPPLLGETLTRVLLLGSANTSDAAREHADLIIRPRAEGVGLLEFHQLDAAVQAGRQAAREALEQPPGTLFS